MTPFPRRLDIAASAMFILFFARRAFAQETPAQATPAQQTSGTQRSAEARLAAGAKPKASGRAEDVINTLSATHRFEQAAISPDGKKVAWVEDVITKSGVSTGEPVIYVTEIATKNPPN